MIMDRQLIFSDAQAITVTANGTNVYDQGAAGILSPNGDLHIEAQVVTAFAGGTSIQASLVESASSSLTSPNTLAAGPVVTTANAKLGTKLLDARPPRTSLRYIGVVYTVVGTMSAGAVTTGMVFDTDTGALLPAVTGL